MKKQVQYISLVLLASLLGSAFAAPELSGDAQALQQVKALQQPKASANTNTDSSIPEVLRKIQQRQREQLRRNLSSNSAVRAQRAAQPSTASQRRVAPAAAAQTTMSQAADPVNAQAFSNTVHQLMPLSPEQILMLRKMYNERQYAVSSTPGVPPKPTATSKFVNLAPGSTPPVIRLAQGFVSSLVLLDSSGQPWPIVDYDLGNPQAFNLQWDKKSNTLMIQSMKQYTYGNLAIRLKGLNTPVMLTLIPGQKIVDYRVDLRVQGYGPDAKHMPVGHGLPPSADPLLLSVLDGVPPPGSQPLTVLGGAARVWALEGKLYVRTRLSIVSPGWLATLSSADGMHAYVMQKTPTLLVSRAGQLAQLKIKGL